MTPKDIHRAIGLLLYDIGNREGVVDELEDAWNLVREWCEIEPVADRESGIDPYPEWCGPSFESRDSADQEERRKFEELQRFTNKCRQLWPGSRIVFKASDAACIDLNTSKPKGNESAKEI